jgi:hypothetical protein
MKLSYLLITVSKIKLLNLIHSIDSLLAKHILKRKDSISSLNFTDNVKVIFGGLLIITMSTVILILTQHSQYADAINQQQSNGSQKIYHSNATGATITFHGNSITSNTSNRTSTNKTGVTGFDKENSMRNMTNPMFLMKRNPLTNLTNPLSK